jgi:hypothetical protein
MPATIEVIFAPGFAAPLPARWETNPPRSSPCNPARSANRNTGTSPAHNTRFGLSNVADTATAM